MAQFLQTHRTAVGVVATCFCLCLALVFLTVGPRASQTNGAAAAILRYGHSGCWLLLAAASTAYGLNAPEAWPKALAATALLVYVCYLVTLVKPSTSSA